MTIIDQLQDIKKNRRQGDIKELHGITKLNTGLISNYIKNGHRMVLKPYIAERIINGYKKLERFDI